MEQQSVAVGESDAGIGAATTNEERFTEVSIQGEPRIGQEPPILRLEEQQLVPNTPSELQPDKDGNPPKIIPNLIRKLRGKYFTVKHVRLNDCGHLLDMINQPKNNCEVCWFNWFNAHAQLVETRTSSTQKHGKGPMVAMRGVKFVKNFFRFMATVAHFMKEAQEKEMSLIIKKEISPNQQSTASPRVPRYLRRKS